jgi:membrane-bound metal-dependent hydrolase YbcI (DUF457 family)
LFGEHILFSAAVAIIIGAIYTNRTGYVLPVWIIAASCWAPDIDYILQSITHPLSYITHFCIIHGQFHTLWGLLAFAAIIAYLFNKYKGMDWKPVFACAAIGYTTHITCDFFVYDTVIEPLFPVFNCVLWTCPIIDEFGSFYGIGELSIYLWGIMFLIISVMIKFTLSESKWIETQSCVSLSDNDSHKDVSTQG